MAATLSTLEVSDLPAGLGAARPVELPATRYQQGGRTQFHVAVPVAEMTRLLVNTPDPNKPLDGNRRVDPLRARKFGEYLLKNNDWVSPAVIVRVPAHEVEFEVKAPFPDGTAWGVLRIRLDLLTEIVLLDGQHRTLGIFLALEMINERISRHRQTIAGLRDQGADPAAIAEQEARLNSDQWVRRRLSEEHISIDVAEVGPDEAKQMFGDINNNAKGVNPDFTTVLDQRDVVNRIALQLIQSHVLFQDRVELGQSSRMSAGNQNLVGAKGVADIVRSVLVGSGRVGARVEDKISTSMAASVTKAEQFLDVLVGAFDDLVDVIDGRIEPRELREKTMLGSVTMLRVFAIVYHDLVNAKPGQRVFSRAEVEDFFRKLTPALRRIPVDDHDNLWMDTKAFLPGSSAPQARQGTIKSLAEAMVDWARTGLPSPDVHGGPEDGTDR